MSPREKILSAISINKPAFIKLPVPDMEQVTNYDNLVARFTAILESIGGKVEHVQDIQELELMISNEINERHFIVSTINDKPGITGNQSATELEGVHKAYLKAGIGVAENGSVWITESQMINRLLPFICQHLVIVLEKKNIVSTMHHAYKKIDVFEEGFGVFIAGPSKTADIEQSLVIGAHGARSLTVFLLN